MKAVAVAFVPKEINESQRLRFDSKVDCQRQCTADGHQIAQPRNGSWANPTLYMQFPTSDPAWVEARSPCASSPRTAVSVFFCGATATRASAQVRRANPTRSLRPRVECRFPNVSQRSRNLLPALTGALRGGSVAVTSNLHLAQASKARRRVRRRTTQPIKEMCGEKTAIPK